MRILLDHNLPRRIRSALTGHQVSTAREMHWEELRNGDLLRSASVAGFDLLLSADKNLDYEQNLSQLPLTVIVLDVHSNALPALLPLVPAIMELCAAPIERLLYVLQADGRILKLRQPRFPRP